MSFQEFQHKLQHTEYTLSCFKLFISKPSIELPRVKYHRVIFSG